MSTIDPSSLGESGDLEFERAVANCTSAAEISALMRDRAVLKGVVRQDVYDPNVLIPVEQRQPQKYAKAVTDGNGKKLIFEGDTELEVEQRFGEYFRSLNLSHPNQPAAETETRGTDDQFVEPDNGMQSIESDLVARSLRAQGIDPDALREFSNQRAVQSWEAATEEFKAGQGRDWVGGDENLATVARLLEENNLTNKPSAETLSKVWEFMKSNNIVVPNPELEAKDRINEATSFEEIRQAGSSLFGR